MTFCCRNNLMVVDIFYAELRYDKVIQQKAYDIPSFFGNNYFFVIFICYLKPNFENKYAAVYEMQRTLWHF